MKIIVTGGAGFIGSHLSERLKKDGHQVTVVDNLSAGDNNTGILKELGIPLIIQDISKIENLSKIFFNAEIVFHLAAMNRAGRSVADPVGAHASNATGTLNVFEAARQNNVRRVIFVSSSSVLGGSEGILLPSTPYNPLHPYGVGKATGEMYAKIYNTLYGLDITILRYFSIYGPRQRGDLDYPAVIAKFVHLALNGQPLTIYEDGRQLRNYTYIGDAVEATIKSMEELKSKGQILHIANSNESTIIDIVRTIERIIGKKVETVHQSLTAPEPKRNLPDITESIRLLKWQPKVSLEEGIRHYLDWYRLETGAKK